MLLKKIALFSFLAVMIPVVSVLVGLPSPIPSLIGTLFLLWVLFVYGKKEEQRLNFNPQTQTQSYVLILSHSLSLLHSYTISHSRTIASQLTVGSTI